MAKVATTLREHRIASTETKKEEIITLVCNQLLSNSGYLKRSGQAISGDIRNSLDALVSALRNELTLLLQRNAPLIFTMDGWSSMSRKEFQSVTVQWPSCFTPDPRSQSGAPAITRRVVGLSLMTELHANVDIRQAASSTLDRVGLSYNSFFAWVCDNAPSQKLAAGASFVPCMAHTLQLALKYEYTQLISQLRPVFDLNCSLSMSVALGEKWLSQQQALFLGGKSGATPLVNK